MVGDNNAGNGLDDDDALLALHIVSTSSVTRYLAAGVGEELPSCRTDCGRRRG